MASDIPEAEVEAVAQAICTDDCRTDEQRRRITLAPNALATWQHNGMKVHGATYRRHAAAAIRALIARGWTAPR